MVMIMNCWNVVNCLSLNEFGQNRIINEGVNCSKIVRFFPNNPPPTNKNCNLPCNMLQTFGHLFYTTFDIMHLSIKV